MIGRLICKDLDLRRKPFIGFYAFLWFEFGIDTD
jgi:hypothetical protein